MRQIKFRAWDGEKMLYQTEDYTFLFDGVGTSVRKTHDPTVFLPLKGLMQFTGLLDKNGKEIYEGDIVKTKWQEKAEMIWVESEACFALKTIDEIIKDEIMYGFKDTEMEIIGNIYQNPELIK